MLNLHRSDAFIDEYVSHQDTGCKVTRHLYHDEIYSDQMVVGGK